MAIASLASLRCTTVFLLTILFIFLFLCTPDTAADRVGPTSYSNDPALPLTPPGPCMSHPVCSMVRGRAPFWRTPADTQEGRLHPRRTPHPSTWPPRACNPLRNLVTYQNQSTSALMCAIALCAAAELHWRGDRVPGAGAKCGCGHGLLRQVLRQCQVSSTATQWL